MNRQKKYVVLLVLTLVLFIAAPVIAQNAGNANASQTYWVGEYFNNPDLAGEPALVLLDPTLNFAWGANSPAPGMIQPDHFSARWTRTLTLDPGQYRFTTTVDDGVRLWVNNQQIINQWAVHSTQAYTATISLPGGATPVRMEYFDDTGAATARLDWTSIVSPTQASANQSSTVGNVATGIVAGTPVLNVRSGAGTQFAQIATLNNGQTVGLLGRNADASWLQINLPNSGGIGWVSGLYIVPNAVLTNLPNVAAIVLVPTPVSQAVPNTGGETTAVVTGAQILNVRTGPGLQFNAIKTLTGGQQVGLEGRDANAIWVQVSLPDGSLGWVSSTFLRPNVPFTDLPVVQPILSPSATTVPTTTITVPNTGGQTIGAVSGTQTLIVRSGPGTQFGQVTTLSLGQRVRLDGRTADETWLRVRLPNGTLGWVSSIYMTPNVILASLPVVQ